MAVWKKSFRLFMRIGEKMLSLGRKCVYAGMRIEAYQMVLFCRVHKCVILSDDKFFQRTGKSASVSVEFRHPNIWKFQNEGVITIDNQQQRQNFYIFFLPNDWMKLWIRFSSFVCFFCSSWENESILHKCPIP